MERKNMWEGYSEAELKELEAVNARYRECLDVAKTERMCKTYSQTGRRTGLSEPENIYRKWHIFKSRRQSVCRMYGENNCLIPDR